VGPQLFGRELAPVDRAVTVSRRDGQTVITAVPPEATAQISAINVIECADLDSALPSPSGQRSDAVGGSPYLLLTPLGPQIDPVRDDRELIAQVESWRRSLEAQRRYVMGSSLGGIESVATLALRDARTVGVDSPFNQVEGLIIAIDVVLASGGAHAAALAAAHPLARRSQIVVWPFGTDD
jgi:hypothetical protein